MSTPMTVAQSQRVSVPNQLLGALALLVTVPAVRHLRLGVLTTAIRLLKRCCWRGVTWDQATVAIDAVRQAALIVPCRVACMETSLAALLSLALRGRAVQWRIGIATNPYASHAWIAVADTPIGEPLDLEATYRPILVV